MAPVESASILVKKITDNSFHVRSLKHVLQASGESPVELGGVYLVAFPRAVNFQCEIVKTGTLIECNKLHAQLAPQNDQSTTKRPLDSIVDSEIASSASKKPNSPAMTRKSNTSSLNSSVVAAVNSRGSKIKAGELQELINPNKASTNSNSSKLSALTGKSSSPSLFILHKKNLIITIQFSIQETAFLIKLAERDEMLSEMRNERNQLRVENEKLIEGMAALKSSYSKFSQF
jgi:hypothetical protein